MTAEQRIPARHAAGAAGAAGRGDATLAVPDRANAKTPDLTEGRLCGKHAARDLYHSIRIAADLNPWAAPHRQKGATWEKCATKLRAIGCFEDVPTTTIQKKINTCLDYQEVRACSISASAPDHLAQGNDKSKSNDVQILKDGEGGFYFGSQLDRALEARQKAENAAVKKSKAQKKVR
jgi:hypothetical protein